MKRNLGILTVAATALTATSVGAATPCDEPLKMGWENWPPYQIKQDGAPKGIDMDTMRAIAKETGCKIKWVESPWKRQLRSVKKGNIDAALTANYTEDRDKYGTFSEKYLDYESVLWVPSNHNGNYSSLKEFLEAGNTVGVARGFTYGDKADKLLKSGKYKDQVKQNNKVVLNIRMTAAQRVDGTIGNRYTIGYQAKQNGVRGKIRATDAIVQSSPVHILWSEKSVPKDVIKAWDKAIVKLRNDGTFQEIVDKYTAASGS